MSSGELFLQKKYIASLSDKQANLQECIDKLDVDKLLLLLHKLSGSAGMYGFDDITKKASHTYEVLESEKSFESNQFKNAFAELLVSMNDVGNN